jgi:hypothetical protein
MTHSICLAYVKARLLNSYLECHCNSQGELWIWDWTLNSWDEPPSFLVEPNPDLTTTQAWAIAYERLITSHLHLVRR